MTDFEKNDEKPIVRDRRRIDPETGRVRQVPAQTTAGTGTSPEGGKNCDDKTAPVTAEGGAAVTGDGRDGDTTTEILADLKAENAKLSDDLARARAAHYNTEQDYANFVRRSREAAQVSREEGITDAIEALLGILDDISLAREHGDLTGTFASVASKLENLLETRYRLVRFGTVGDEFNPELHEALLAIPSSEVTVDTISQVMQSGYQRDEHVLRAARVAVANPE